MRAVRDLARLAVDAHRLDAGARPRLPAALRLERGGVARLRRRPRLPRAARTSPERTAFLIDQERYGRGAWRYETPRCRTSTSCSRPPGLCSSRLRALPRGAAGRDRAGDPRTADDALHRGGGRSGHGEAAPGDHLQTDYHLWLVGHQLEHGRAPWLDPYSFQPEASPRLNFGGWPFGLPYWPLDGRFGPVLAWNLLILLLVRGRGAVHAALAARARAGRGAALVGGLAFELAPYRVAQSAAICRGPISLLLPLALWAFERALTGSRWWCGARGGRARLDPVLRTSTSRSAAIPFFLLYALCALRGSRARSSPGSPRASPASAVGRWSRP